MQQSIFKCASVPNYLREDVIESAIITQSQLIACHCVPFAENSENMVVMTNSGFQCRLLSFNLVLIQEVAEKLFTEQVTHTIHLKAAEFLEMQNLWW